MENRKLTCIECPKGCSLSVDIENCRVVKVEGHKCPKGSPYAVSEIENPQRVLTATVFARGLSLKLIPVRTDKPIPKAKITDAASAVKKLIVTKPVRTGDVVEADFMGMGVNLIATRPASQYTNDEGGG